VAAAIHDSVQYELRHISDNTLLLHQRSLLKYQRQRVLLHEYIVLSKGQLTNLVNG
jgi:hypothetical protein